MRQLFILAALLMCSGCAVGPRCDTRLTPINASTLRGSADATAVDGAAGRIARRHTPPGTRS